ncbi:MAG: DUF1553 domain-containing protein [Verrucomicrobia bacterium]|nr:DUF1553 domain-containing protein [Verrucomicrobiota bacterium]
MAPPFLGSVYGGTIDFNRDVRPILSNQCIACHGPDEEQRKAGLRLDTRAGAVADLGGYAAVVPGHPERSELVERLLTTDEEERMPPGSKGPRLSDKEISILREWVRQGAEYAAHWAYVVPRSHPLPSVKDAGWPVNEIDRFLLARMEKEGLAPTAEADLGTLARRVSLDLTGLPPAWESVESLKKSSPGDGYGAFVDAMLSSPAFGEHWATGWLDLARYADSSGYPSDQPREIWGYRDWVIDAFNGNLPFDRFTVDQIAGDLVPGRKESQLIATAFHRNTMTQNEGGTSDEEFRIAAVVDRVNTTMAVWMGTTMACAQCHTHKYDPITQTEYYRVFAILNQSADADRKDETPLADFFTPAQKRERSEIEARISKLDESFAHPRPEFLAGVGPWEASLALRPVWKPARLHSVGFSGEGAVVPEADGRVLVPPSPQPKSGASTDVAVSLEAPVHAVRLEVLADPRLPGGGPGYAAGNFVLSSVLADFIPPSAVPVTARKLRIETTGGDTHPLALAEVEVFSGMENVARRGRATQNGTSPAGAAAQAAIDGQTDGAGATGKAVALTSGEGGLQWWEVELAADQPVDRIVIWKRADKGPGAEQGALRLILIEAGGKVAWEQKTAPVATSALEVSVSGRRRLRFADAFADATQAGFSARDVIKGAVAPDKGWALGGFTGVDRHLTLVLSELTGEPGGVLALRLEQRSQFAGHTLGAFRLGVTGEKGLDRVAALTDPVRAALLVGKADRTAAQEALIRDYHVRQVAPGLAWERQELAALRSRLEGIRPSTVPVMTDLPKEQRRVTRVQIRGNWQNLGDEVDPGVPEAFHPLPAGRPVDRLALAEWLVSRDNPLTARVIVNRYWEAIFGVGLVRTSEEFGSQGEAPFHPELLDWLAVDFMEHGWDVKRLLRQMVTSRAYRQDSRSTPRLNETDPENRLLARGPRFRPQGELLRDQALAASGLLSRKIGGPPVRPAAPGMGLSTAFGRSNDWVASEGEDRLRRAVYTEVRRNAPYASFSTFDAPNREVCTIRRNRTNTPLQAFVTLNDPVFVEASQALARKMAETPGGTADPGAAVRRGFRDCLSRDPSSHEVNTLTTLYRTALAEYGSAEGQGLAAQMAMQPLGPLGAGSRLSVPEAAAWTVVANVILNLDEFLMRR